MTNYCSKCKELFIYVSILRHDTHSKPVEQQIDPTYCPICGNKLESCTKETAKECLF